MAGTIVNRTSVYHAASSTTTHTLSMTVSAGTKRKAVVATTRDGANTFSGCTFNGNAMTQVVTLQHPDSTACEARLWEYDIPDALDAGAYNAVVTMSGGSNYVSMYGWQLAGIATGAAEDTDSISGVAADNALSRTLDVTAGAVLLAVMTDRTTDNMNLTWSGAVTERAESYGASHAISTADDEQATGGSKTVTVTVTSTGNDTQKVLLAASFAAAAEPPPAPSGARIVVSFRPPA